MTSPDQLLFLTRNCDLSKRIKKTSFLCLHKFMKHCPVKKLFFSEKPSCKNCTDRI